MNATCFQLTRESPAGRPRQEKRLIVDGLLTQAASYQCKCTTDQPRFQANIPLNSVIVYCSASYEELRTNKEQTAVINMKKYKRISRKKKDFYVTFRFF